MTSYIENTVILCFWPHFRSNLICFGHLRYPKAPILAQICLTCIIQARFQGYKPFSDVSGLQWLHVLEIMWFFVFDPIYSKKGGPGLDITAWVLVGKYWDNHGSKGLSPFDEKMKKIIFFIIILSTYISFWKDDLFHLWVIFENIPKYSQI